MVVFVQRSGHLFDSCRVVGIESDGSLEQLQRLRDLTFLSLDQTCSQQHMEGEDSTCSQQHMEGEDST